MLGDMTVNELTLSLLEATADNLCKQFGIRSGRTECLFLSGSKHLDTLIVLLKEFFEFLFLKYVSRRLQKHENYPACNELQNKLKKKYKDCS